jgi:hypothetical protein
MNLHPAPGFLKIEKTDIQEYQHPSGLQLPGTARVGSHEIKIERGLVLEMGKARPMGDLDEMLEIGTPIWYQVSTKDALEIVGCVFITYDMILAWESD